MLSSNIRACQTECEIRNRHQVFAFAEGTWNTVFCSESETAAVRYMQKRFASYPYVRLMRVEVAEVLEPGDKIEDEAKYDD